MAAITLHIWALWRKHQYYVDFDHTIASIFACNESSLRLTLRSARPDCDFDQPFAIVMNNQALLVDIVAPSTIQRLNFTNFTDIKTYIDHLIEAPGGVEIDSSVRQVDDFMAASARLEIINTPIGAI